MKKKLLKKYLESKFNINIRKKLKSILPVKEMDSIDGNYTP